MKAIRTIYEARFGALGVDNRNRAEKMRMRMNWWMLSTGGVRMLKTARTKRILQLIACKIDPQSGAEHETLSLQRGPTGL